MQRKELTTVLYSCSFVERSKTMSGKQEVRDNGCPLRPHPSVLIDQFEKDWNLKCHTEEYARKLDENDPLREFQDKFFYPKCGKSPKGE